MLSTEASDAARSLVRVLKEEIPEVRVGGPDIAWPFQQSMHAMKIIVGSKP
jgi:hypothetical protein